MFDLNVRLAFPGLKNANLDSTSSVTSLQCIAFQLRVFSVHPVLGFIKNYNPANLAVNKGEVFILTSVVF